MRWPSRQITQSEIAGASGRAAMARARSASTSPSAPSATCASVSGWPGCSKFGGRSSHRTHVFAARRDGNRAGGGTARCRSRRVRPARRSPRQRSAGRELRASVSYSSSSASLKSRDMRVGEAAEHQVHLADAAVPAAEQQPPPARVQPFARNPDAGHAACSNAKNPDGAGRGLYRGLRGRLSASALHRPSIASAEAAQASMALHAPARAQSAVCLAHQPARRRAEAGKALCPAARPRGAARHRSAVPPALRRHRPPRAAETARRAGRPGGHRRGNRRRAPPGPAATAPRAPYRIYHQRRYRRR